MNTTDSRAATRLKILVQYRSKHGMVLELANGVAVLTVQISRRRSSEDSGDWHIETRMGAGLLGPAVADEWGDTAAEALSKAADSWKARRPELEYFDWEAVASELRAVNAV